MKHTFNGWENSDFTVGTACGNYRDFTIEVDVLFEHTGGIKSFVDIVDAVDALNAAAIVATLAKFVKRRQPVRIGKDVSTIFDEYEIGRWNVVITIKLLLFALV